MITTRRGRRHGDGDHAETAARTGDLPRPDRAGAEGRPRLRQPRGHADRRLRIAKCAGANPEECFAFRAPPEYAKYLRGSGIHVMSYANNHSYDFGEAGEEETIEALRRAGIDQTGLPGRDHVLQAGGRRVAFLGFAPYSNTPAHRPRSGPRADPGRRASARRHRRRRDPRRRRGDRRHARQRRGGDLPRRGPRQRRGVRPHGGRRRRRPRARLRPARPARDGDLPRPADRLQPRQLLRLLQLRPRRGAWRDASSCTSTLAADGAFRARPPRLGQPGRSRPAGPRPDRRGAALVGELSEEDFGPRGVAVHPGGRITAR